MLNNRSETDQSARKVSKLIDEEEKNEQRMAKQLRASTKKTNFPKKKLDKITKINFRNTSSFLTQKNEDVIRRLTFSEIPKQSRLRDKFGFRNPLDNDPESDKYPEFLKRTNPFGRSFTTSNKMDLKLP